MWIFDFQIQVTKFLWGREQSITLGLTIKTALRFNIANAEHTIGHYSVNFQFFLYSYIIYNILILINTAQFSTDS